MDATDLIRGHIHSTLDHKAATDLLTLVPLRSLCSTLASLLQAGDEAAIRDALLVIRDAVNMTQGARRGAFRVGLRRYGIIERIEECLFADSHFTRGAAVYTLGKINSTASIPALRRAFMAYRDTDPILVPSAILESAWLGADEWALFDLAIDSPVYTTRWSVIEKLARDAGDPVSRANQVERLARLVHDENLLVSREASYAYAALALAPREQLRSETTGCREESAEIVPLLLFTECELRFTNYLIQEQRHTYTVRELEDFIAGMIVVPSGTA